MLRKCHYIINVPENNYQKFIFNIICATKLVKNILIQYYMQECNAQNTRLRLMASIDSMGELVCRTFRIYPISFLNKINDPMPLTLGNE